MAYKQIDERFWKDKKIKKLSKDGYILFLYLLTSPHTHFSGLSEMSLDYVNIDTPLNENESKSAYKELCALGLIQYDPENEIVWIKNMHKYQIKSAKQLKGAQNHIQNLPRSILCKNLAEILKIPYTYPINTLSIAENTPPIKEEAKAKAKEEVYISDDETETEIIEKEINISGKVQDVEMKIPEWVDAFGVMHFRPLELAAISELIKRGCLPEDAKRARLTPGACFGKATNEHTCKLIMTERDLRLQRQDNPPETKRGWAF